MCIVVNAMSLNGNLGPIAGDKSMLNKCLSSSSEVMNIGHINAQSLCPSASSTKLDEFKCFFYNSLLDIIGVSETWFKPHLISQSLTLSGYNLVRNDRIRNTTSNNSGPTRGGGVCLYISNKLRYRILFRAEQYGVCESLFVEVFGNGTSVIVGVVYLPGGDINAFESIHNNLFDQYNNIIVMGDFNHNLFDIVKSRNLRSLISRCGLHCIHNCLPTHIFPPNNATSLLDYFLLSQPSSVVYKNQIQIPFFSSYHSFIFLCIKFPSQLRSTWIEFKDYNRLNFENINKYDNMENFEINLNVHLNSISSWMYTNSLEINPTKTKALSFNLTNRTFSFPRISINGQAILFVESLRCLGVIIDSKLNFNEHINLIANKTCLILRRLYSLRAFTPKHVRSRLAFSLIMSRINYCLEVFSATWSYNLNIIEATVRKVIRYVFNLRALEHDRTSMLTPVFLKCSFNNYINLRILLYFYKVIKSGKPISLVNQFSFINSTRNIQIFIPLGHLSVFDRSFVKRIHHTWSLLPNHLKQFSYSSHTYKKKLLDFFNENQ
ncbi:uncharacterized protein LOC119612237 [Lucilia sericata]|uniref:uncharacterized protein LOC119606494 n=1 Tax=Lucilia sericata TaxID=13632 RepID=UPI0018A80433|nr:uncharacterized protein LOC119606494 [Lucilia sericata]XP_037816713.1 uncharacterized protein LOC119607050 [Lucilia sericata]XP_037818266.1 uncharacterized protein LOC119608077 [Lucilia sericata]XP_037819835.1 uncharacterized protein LOC119609196 [Lucilia sericata]XP_037823921.1 uncharacterized protein LOC119612237 [Lucilia sericata]